MVDVTPEQIAAGLSDIQRGAILRSIFLAGFWGLSDWNEDSRDIVEDLSENIADPISGELTPVGLAVRKILEAGNEPG